MSKEQEEPLWKRIWRKDGIRYLGRFGDGHIDHMDRFEHSFNLGYQAGVLAAARDFDLPEGSHVAAMTWTQDEDERE
jgi:hypothetical protein